MLNGPLTTVTFSDVVSLTSSLQMVTFAMCSDRKGMDRRLLASLTQEKSE